MDIAKLEKLKVADLRSELQARGLDTKGVKAVLIERLKAAMDAGESTLVSTGETLSNTPVTDLSTPNRRGRRTRSRTHSPTPSPVKKIESALEPLQEEVPSTSVPDEDEEMFTSSNAIEDKNQLEDQFVNNDNESIGEAEEGATNGEADEPAENLEKDETEEEGHSDVDNEKDKNMVEGDSTDATLAQTDEKANLSIKTTEEHSSTIGKRSSRKRSRSRSMSHSRSRSKSRTHSKDRQLSKSRSGSKSSRSRSRSQSQKYRRGGARTSPGKAAEETTNAEDEPTIEDKQFGLSWFDSDLHLTIDPVTFTSAKPMSQEIFSLVWSGARTNYGVREGKVCYEVRLAEETQFSRSHQFRDEPYLRGLRCGFSSSKTGLLLGEDKNSFAYCDTGRKAVNNEFLEYGKPFKLDDVIGCYLNLDSSPCTIKYTLNGEDLGTAFEFEKSSLDETEALFPHIVTKGYEFHVNFADNENLLGNVERPKRMKKKISPEHESEKEKKILTDSNEENWEVVDEAKDDDDEKSEKRDEGGDSSVLDVDNGGDVDMKDLEKSKGNTEENIEDNVEKKLDEEVDGKEENSNRKDESDEKKKSTDANGESEMDNCEKPAEKESGANASHSGDNCSETSRTSSGPPRKKRKQDDSAEDEMEEVEPEPRDRVALVQGYELIALIPEEQYIPGPQRPESRKECEVYLLVGLPGAGKTHWTLKHIKENPDKRYDAIGADALIAKMTVDGKPRKSVHKGKWDRVYELCLSSLSSLEEIATKRRRNFILDQTNAYASAQRRKMKGFGDFKRIAVVCIPSEDELKRRITLKSEQGNANSVRESTLNNIKASFTLPSLEFSWFDDIIYTDLKGDEAKDEVKKYIEKGSKALEATESRDKRSRRDYNRRDDRRRYDDRRRDDNFRGSRWKSGYNERRGGSGNRWGGGGGGGGGHGGSRGGSTPWRDDRGYGGGGGSGGGGGGGGNNGGRGYDNRNNRYGGGGGGGGGPQNWMQNNRNRYDDRFGRSGGVGGGGGGGGGGGSSSGRRYDSYGGGSRDYRDRDRSHGGGGGGGGGGNSSRRDNNYRSGNQRDFRPGHRDNRIEDSRGGYERSSSKYSSNDTYDPYSSGKPVCSTGSGGGNGAPTKHQNSSSSSQGGKWSTYSQQQAAGWGGGAQQNQQQQQYQTQAQPQQQQYWGYDQMQGYGNQQQQWPAPNSADPRQQQQWMAWWQQQSNNQPQQAQPQQQATTNSGGQNQYWSQYSYPSQQSTAGTDGNSSKK